MAYHWLVVTFEKKVDTLNTRNSWFKTGFQLSPTVGEANLDSADGRAPH